MDLTANVDAIMGRLEKILNTKTVVGEPIQVGNVTLIPVADVTFGFGSGGGSGGSCPDKPNEPAGEGGGGGGGARVAPKAVIVIQGDQVSVMPMSRGGAIERVMEAVPGLIEKLQTMKGGKDKAADE